MFKLLAAEVVERVAAECERAELMGHFCSDVITDVAALNTRMRACLVAQNRFKRRRYYINFFRVNWVSVVNAQ